MGLRNHWRKYRLNVHERKLSHYQTLIEGNNVSNSDAASNTITIQTLAAELEALKQRLQRMDTKTVANRSESIIFPRPDFGPAPQEVVRLNRSYVNPLTTTGTQRIDLLSSGPVDSSKNQLQMRKINYATHGSTNFLPFDDDVSTTKVANEVTSEGASVLLVTAENKANISSHLTSDFETKVSATDGSSLTGYEDAPDSVNTNAQSILPL